MLYHGMGRREAEEACRGCIARRGIPPYCRCSSSPAAPSVNFAMTDTLAISLAQLNPTVGDIDGNAAQVRRARSEAKGQGADLVIYSELNMCGYPPEDLVLKPAFQEGCEAAVKALAAETADGGPALLIGSPWRNEGKLHNAAVLLADGDV